jgi:hypothetical protein
VGWCRASAQRPCIWRLLLLLVLRWQQGCRQQLPPQATPNSAACGWGPWPWLLLWLLLLPGGGSCCCSSAALVWFGQGCWPLAREHLRFLLIIAVCGLLLLLCLLLLLAVLKG